MKTFIKNQSVTLAHIKKTSIKKECKKHYFIRIYRSPLIDIYILKVNSCNMVNICIFVNVFSNYFKTINLQKKKITSDACTS